ncbi:serine/threonine-protein kinase, partial [Mycobacterium palustre]
MPLRDGALFAGFAIVRLLGAGGTGEVYVVQHPRLPRLQALRILPAALSADPDFRARFHREANLAASLSHPNIVGVHDRGEFDGRLWILMGYVEGITAARLVHDHHPRGLPRAEALQIVGAVAEALDFAHERGLMHRNVKPANILLANAGTAHRRILLADLGIPRRLVNTHAMAAANLCYTAPELLLDTAFEGRADQYALAATAYHLLTGTAPFDHPNPAVVIGRHLNAPPPRLADTRPDLADLDAPLMRALAKDPGARFARCQDLAAALGADTHTRPVPASAPPRCWWWRPP